jgi:DNA-binding NtrC family response regulator
VLVTGETGTGKELMARALHRLSGRPGELVAVNMAGLDDTMFETIVIFCAGIVVVSVLRRPDA